MKFFTAIIATFVLVLLSPIMTACSMVKETTSTPETSVSAPVQDQDKAVTVNPGNGHGEAITADYLEMHYILFEDCSLAIEHNGEYVGGLNDYRELGADSPVRAPLADTTADVMPWCADTQ